MLQHFPHTSFDDETSFMQDLFGNLGLAGECYVLGDEVNGLEWHVYLASNPNKRYHEKTVTHAFEVCMTELDETKARAFFRSKDFVSAEQTTVDSGIRALLPHAAIDDYVFDPCGYSMNGVQDGGYMTIHITPEKGFSYASVELCGFAFDKFEPAVMLHQITEIFNPGKMSVSVSVDEASQEAFQWGSVLEAPAGYSCESGTCQEFMAGGRVVFYNLSSNCSSSGLEEPGSPVTVLHQCDSPTMSDSDEGMDGACSD
jgi:S-adenosylmethionine decarboxylase